MRLSNLLQFLCLLTFYTMMINATGDEGHKLLKANEVFGNLEIRSYSDDKCKGKSEPHINEVVQKSNYFVQCKDSDQYQVSSYYFKNMVKPKDVAGKNGECVPVTFKNADEKEETKYIKATWDEGCGKELPESNFKDIKVEEYGSYKNCKIDKEAKKLTDDDTEKYTKNLQCIAGHMYTKEGKVVRNGCDEYGLKVTWTGGCGDWQKKHVHLYSTTYEKSDCSGEKTLSAAAYVDENILCHKKDNIQMPPVYLTEGVVDVQKMSMKRNQCYDNRIVNWTGFCTSVDTCKGDDKNSLKETCKCDTNLPEGECKAGNYCWENRTCQTMAKPTMKGWAWLLIGMSIMIGVGAIGGLIYCLISKKKKAGAQSRV